MVYQHRMKQRKKSTKKKKKHVTVVIYVDGQMHDASYFGQWTARVPHENVSVWLLNEMDFNQEKKKQIDKERLAAASPLRYQKHPFDFINTSVNIVINPIYLHATRRRYYHFLMLQVAKYMFQWCYCNNVASNVVVGFSNEIPSSSKNQKC